MTSLPALQPSADGHLAVIDPFAGPVDPRSAAASGAGDRGGSGRPPQLAVVARRPGAATYWRRRAGVLAILLVLVMLLVGVIGQVASAELADRVDGHVVIEPGQTLWDVAVATAPTEVDARDQLARIEELNGVRASDVEAWNVILLPAR